MLRIKVHVKIGAPYPEKLDEKKTLKAIPFGEKSIEVVQGGLVFKNNKELVFKNNKV